MAVFFVPFFGKSTPDKNTTFDNSDFRSIVPRFKPENIEANQTLVELIQKIAAEKNVTPAQIALAWVLVLKPSIIV
ncbi:aldo/keto reductase [Paenibacillus sp. IHBB 3054]|uniref:aldo/keto reductase n=1 Tax=Paenibacillus sp. IHBB 3054 TaxID=3425689 RepID=UPI003F67CB5A